MQADDFLPFSFSFPDKKRKKNNNNPHHHHQNYHNR